MSDEWRSRAACRGLDSNLFFLPRGGGGRYSDVAKSVCLGCPVVDECLAYSLVPGNTYGMGIWGGKTGAERRQRGRRNQYA